MDCEGLHATLVSRFIYDCAYFGKEVSAMVDAVIGAGAAAPGPSCPAPELAYRTTFEVQMPSSVAQHALLPHSDMLAGKGGQ